MLVIIAIHGNHMHDVCFTVEGRDKAQTPLFMIMSSIMSYHYIIYLHSYAVDGYRSNSRGLVVLGFKFTILQSEALCPTQQQLWLFPPFFL